jgi:hypothetical protein
MKNKIDQLESNKKQTGLSKASKCQYKKLFCLTCQCDNKENCSFTIHKLANPRGGTCGETPGCYGDGLFQK